MAGAGHRTLRRNSIYRAHLMPAQSPHSGQDDGCGKRSAVRYRIGPEDHAGDSGDDHRKGDISGVVLSEQGEVHPCDLRNAVRRVWRTGSLGHGFASATSWRRPKVGKYRDYPGISEAGNRGGYPCPSDFQSSRVCAHAHAG